MKKFECAKCKVRQKIKENQLWINNNGDKYGLCAKCRTRELMRPLSEE